MTGDCTLTEHSAAHKVPNYQQAHRQCRIDQAPQKPNIKCGNQKDRHKIPPIPAHIFPECIRNNVNWMSKETRLTDLENQMEQTEFAAGHLINIKIAIDSLLLKEKAKMKEWQLEKKQSAECIIPLCCRRQSFF